MAVALKESDETEYWILLLQETGYLNPGDTESIINDTTELMKLLTSIINSTKQKSTL